MIVSEVNIQPQGRIPLWPHTEKWYYYKLANWCEASKLSLPCRAMLGGISAILPTTYASQVSARVASIKQRPAPYRGSIHNTWRRLQNRGLFSSPSFVCELIYLYVISEQLAKGCSAGGRIAVTDFPASRVNHFALCLPVSRHNFSDSHFFTILYINDFW